MITEPLGSNEKRKFLHLPLTRFLFCKFIKHAIVWITIALTHLLYNEPSIVKYIHFSMLFLKLYFVSF